jgi:hypothetical protein
MRRISHKRLILWSFGGIPFIKGVSSKEDSHRKAAKDAKFCWNIGRMEEWNDGRVGNQCVNRLQVTSLTPYELHLTT